jgi:hypothetical protein
MSLLTYLKAKAEAKAKEAIFILASALAFDTASGE